MNRISRKVVITTIVALMTLQIAFSICLFGIDRSHQLAALELKASRVAARIAATDPVPGPLVNEMVDEQIAGILKRNTRGEVVDGRIRLSDGELVVFDAAAHLELLRKQRIAKFSPVEANGESSGTVDVYMSNSRLNQGLTMLALRLAGGAVILVLLVGLVLIYTVRSAVSRPIAELEQEFERFNSGDTDDQFSGDYPAELGTLIGSIERIRQKQRLLVAILENTSDVVATATPDGTITYINYAGQEMIGAESITDLRLSDLHPEWAFERIRKIGIPEAIRHGAWEGETALRSCDGDEIPVSQVIIAHKNASGTIHYFSTIIRDISERKKVENELAMHRSRLEELVAERTEQLRQSEEESRHLFEMSPIGLWRRSLADGKFIQANAAACRVLGVDDLSDLQGETLPFTAHDADRDKQFRTLLRAEGQVSDFEMPFRLADGSIRYLSLTVKRYNAEQYSEGAFIDITKRKEMEARLEEAHQEVVATARMAGMAEVATTVLHNVGNVLNSIGVISRTVKNNILASKVNNLGRICELLSSNRDSLGTFLSESDQGRKLPEYLEKLADHLTRQNGETIQLMDDLIRHVQHVKEIISVQQDQAKISGTTDLCSVGELVNTVIQIVNAGAAKHRLTVTAECEELPPMILDRNSVIQVLLNLVSNAKDALKDSELDDRQLKIHACRSEDDMLVITVTDNGIGIVPEDQSKIFTHGFTTKKEGHGFGLHGAKKMATELDGNLSFHSDGAGLGATFALSIPIRESKAA